MGIIRLLLAVAVFNSHFEIFDMSIVDGHEAVLTFFAISGFYIALILDTSYDRPGNFYKSRFLALYPMYALALIISALFVFAANIHPVENRETILSVLSDPAGFLLMLWTSFCVLGQELLFCIGQAADGSLHFVKLTRESIYDHAFLIQAWSLSLETMFYLLAPLLVRLKSRTLMGICLASLLLRLTILATPAAKISFFLRFFPADFWLFGCGILCYRFFRELSEEAQPIDYLAFVVLVCAVFVAGEVEKIYEPFFLPACALLTMPFIFRGFKALPMDCTVGKITYPFYLLHFTVIAIFEECFDEPEGWHVLAVAMAAAIITFSLLNPAIERLKSGYRKRNAALAHPEYPSAFCLKQEG